METILAVLRPKALPTVTPGFRPRDFDILLTEVKINNRAEGRTRIIKQLPKVLISYEEEPTEALLSYLYRVTGKGLRGKRAVFIPPSGSEPLGSGSETGSKGTLYCIPLDCKDVLDFNKTEKSTILPGFYSYDMTINPEKSASFAFSKQTKVMLMRLLHWLNEKNSVPGAMGLLLSPTSDHRLQQVVTNKAFEIEESRLAADQSNSLATDTSSLSSYYNEPLMCMLRLDKVDRCYKNSLFDCGLEYNDRVDMAVVNPHWGKGVPDYSKIATTVGYPTDRYKHDSRLIVTYPAHHAAYLGDSEALQRCIDSGLDVDVYDSQRWKPIHYAAWFGHLQVMALLLDAANCDPKSVNPSGSTPLHISASNSHPYVVELLLNHPMVDVLYRNHEGHTPHDLCVSSSEENGKACAKLLKTAMERQIPKIQVFLMDRTFRMLSLTSGALTTVQQLHDQMMEELDLPAFCNSLFTIWICSRSLQLQLKPDHKPIQHLNDWKRSIIDKLTDAEPAREDPQLFWKRDAILALKDEKLVSHPKAIELLFNEAYHNYLQCLYPCDANDVLNMAAILMHCMHGEYVQRKAKQLLQNERILRGIIPVVKLNEKGAGWPAKIETQYRKYSNSVKPSCYSTTELYQHFLLNCWNLIVYGSAFFTGYVNNNTKNQRTPTRVYVAVNDVGAHIIHERRKMMMYSYHYDTSEWRSKDNYLQLAYKSDHRSAVLVVFSKQSGLINHLMNKMRRLTMSPDPVASPEPSTSSKPS